MARWTLVFAVSFLLWLHFPSARSQDIPGCDFMDTANITNSQKFANGSYLFENLLIPADLVGIYNYNVVNGSHRVSVAAHVRGCVCKLRSCVKFCCHPRARKKDDSMECIEELEEELQYSPLIEVTLNNGSRQMVHVLEEFVVQQGIPCHDGYPLSPEESDDDNWTLFENGTLLRMYDMAFLNKSEYCLNPSQFNDTYILNPINCPVYQEKTNTEKINGMMMLISIPFLVLTIIVYLAIPELQNLHGKCLISYLVALALGYSMLVTISFEDIGNQFSDTACRTFGYVGFFCLISAFFWLSVISFDLWHNFCATKCNNNRFIQRKRFYVYSLYAWGIPVILTGLTMYAQHSDLDVSLKPGIGVDYCWLNNDLWSPMIYFYGPILLLMLFNVSMFVLTAVKIYRVQRELARIVAREESTKHLRTQKDNFGLFLRLFIVMGVPWLLEVFSFMVGNDNLWSKFFWLPDICNAAQGIIIFVLFVLKTKVKVLIKKRFSHQSKEYFVYSTIHKTSGACNNVRLSKIGDVSSRIN